MDWRVDDMKLMVWFGSTPCYVIGWMGKAKGSLVASVTSVAGVAGVASVLGIYSGGLACVPVTFKC